MAAAEWNLGRPLDLYADLGRGRVIVTNLGEGRWMTTWLPRDEADPAYPGFTLESKDTSMPTEDGEEGILAWVLAQKWAQPEAR